MNYLEYQKWFESFSGFFRKCVFRFECIVCKECLCFWEVDRQLGTTLS